MGAAHGNFSGCCFKGAMEADLFSKLESTVVKNHDLYLVIASTAGIKLLILKHCPFIKTFLFSFPERTFIFWQFLSDIKNIKHCTDTCDIKIELRTFKNNQNCQKAKIYRKEKKGKKRWASKELRYCT